MVWSAWRGSSGDSATSVYRVDVAVVVLLLAGLPLLARWPFGVPLDCRASRFLRVGTYAAILILIPAKNVVEQILGAPPRGGVELRLYRLIGGIGFGSDWTSEIAFLVIVALYAAAVLWVTSRRSGLLQPRSPSARVRASLSALSSIRRRPARAQQRRHQSVAARSRYRPARRAGVDPVGRWPGSRRRNRRTALHCVKRHTAVRQRQGPPDRGGGTTDQPGRRAVLHLAATSTTALMIKGGLAATRALYHGQHSCSGSPACGFSYRQPGSTHVQPRDHRRCRRTCVPAGLRPVRAHRPRTDRNHRARRPSQHPQGAR